MIYFKRLFFKLLSDSNGPLYIYLGFPKVENDIKSQNVKRGMRQANKEGRYLGPAPKGYRNSSDFEERPIIVKNQDEVFIKDAFELIDSQLYSQREALRILRKKGFNCGKLQFSELLQNPIYKGKVKVRATQDEAEYYVTGIHDPIVTEELFDRVQDILAGRRAKTKNNKPKQKDEFLPLRGFLVCPSCGHHMTGSKSKGRSSHYYYYHCNDCGERYRTDMINSQFEAMLAEVQIEPEANLLYLEVLKDLLIGDEQTRQKEIKKYDTEMVKFKERIDKLTDKYADGEIDTITFTNAKNRYENDFKVLETK